MSKDQTISRAKRNVLRFLLVLKRLVQTFALLFIVIVLVFILLNSSAFLNWSKSRILTLLKEEIENKVEYSSLEFNFFKGAEIKDLIIYDHHNDTLFIAKDVQVSFSKSLASLMNNKLSFNELDISESRLNIIHYKAEDKNSFELFLSQFKQSDGGSSEKLFFKLKELDLNKFDLHVFQQNTGNEKWIALDKAELDIRDMNLTAGFVDVDHINIIRPKIKILQTGKDSNPYENIKVIPDSLCKDYFGLSCKNLKVEDCEFLFSKSRLNSWDSISEDYFNPNFFKLSDLQFEVQNFNLNNTQLYISNIQSSAKVNDYLGINSIRLNGTRFMKDELTINRFQVLTDESHFGDSLSVFIGGSPDVNKILNEAYLQFKLRDTRISCSDLLYFLPKLRQNQFLSRNKDLYVELAGNFMGSVNNLKGFELAIDIPHKLEFKGDIFTHDLTKRGEELLNVKIKHLISSSDFVQSIVPSLSKVQVFNKIGRFKYIGRFDGFIEDFVSDGTFYSDLGVIDSDIRLNIRPGTDEATWSGELSLKEFNLGQLINNSNIGNVSMYARINNGHGLHVDKMTADLEADVYSLFLNNYNYQNLHLNAKINKNLFDGKADIKDKNLDLVFEGKISDLTGIPKLNFTADVKKADLMALNLGKQSYIISAIIESNLIDLDLDKIRGNLIIKKGLVYDYKNNRVINLGDINVNQSRNESNNILALKSDFIDLEMSGDYKFKSAYHQIMTYLSDQYPAIFSDLGLAYNEDRNPISILAHFNITSISRISSFFDIRLATEPIDGNFKIDNKRRICIANLKTKRIKFQNVAIENLNGSLVGDPQHFDGELNINSLYFKDVAIAKNAKISQIFEDSKMRFAITAYDTNSHLESFKINLRSIKSGINKKFIFEGNELLFNGFTWKFVQQASFEIGKNYIGFENMHLYDSISEINVADIDHKGIQLDVKSFDVALFNPLIKSPSMTFTGRYDFSIHSKNVFDLDAVVGDINILNLRINKVSYGRFNVAFVMDDHHEPWKLNVRNEYKETDLNVKGFINIPIGSEYKLTKYDFALEGMANGFPLHFLESFITSISNTKGSLSGPVKIYRENKKVYLDGDFISSASMTKVNYLNTSYHFDKERIKLERNQIQFKNNSIYDEFNHLISVNGKISHDNLTTFTLDVLLKSNKALVLNTTKADNIYYYGKGFMSFQASFNGPTSQIEMNFSGRTEKGSSFIIPVRYDQEATDTKFVRFKTSDTVNYVIPVSSPVVVKGMNIKMDLELTEDCDMSIIFDEKNGDILEGKGNGDIQLSYLRDNTFKINGKYEISSGQYLFTMLNFVNKPFKLKKGGNITWTGDPLNSNINIEANYEGLNISPASLIREYLAGSNNLASEANERTKVDLTMLMKGSLLKPDINFKLGFPNLNGQLRNFADSKLRILEQNPQQLNQQVASLIVFRTFIETNTNEVIGGGIGNVGVTTGINTLSEFLSNQVSIFVSNIISEVFYSKSNIVSGVNFNVNYNPNRTISGTQSTSNEFAFNLKHELLNDEWAVSIGANLGNNTALNNQSYFNSESTIEWNTPVNGLKLRIYYRGVNNGIDGRQRHRVGSGISYRKEFNSLQELRDSRKTQQLEKSETKNN